MKFTKLLEVLRSLKDYNSISKLKLLTFQPKIEYWLNPDGLEAASITVDSNYQHTKAKGVNNSAPIK